MDSATVANALLVFYTEKKRAQERAMDALAEGEALGAHPRVQFSEKSWG